MFPRILLILLLLYTSNCYSQTDHHEDIPKLENPITVEFLQNNLAEGHPRLVLNREIETQLRNKLKTDPVIQNVYAAIKLNADQIVETPLLERKQIGRRLLSTSREFLYRINMLAMVYRIDQEKRVLDRINDEVLAVCSFSDWNPSHFLDVAEMSLGVALALDWTAGDLPDATEELAIQALIDKGIKPSWPEGKQPGWAYGTNNWNQVCNGGMIAASIAVAEREPELAAKTIRRALDGLPVSLIEYGPDGVYPEGSTYWGYGTSFSVVTIAMLESALGTDFGMGEYPAFQESAVFRLLCNAPSGWYYNFADCGDKRSKNGDFTLAWFATNSGNEAYFEKQHFLRDPKEMGKLSRLAGSALVWLSQFEPKVIEPAPTAWKGEGANPIVIFNGGPVDANQYYFGGKGGRGTVNHGNMDAGSFIFELDGIRWVIDPGNQPYHQLEKTGFNLWERCQDCQRWILLTKNNFGHSTLTVNDKLHKVDGMVEMIDFEPGSHPKASFNMAPAFDDLLSAATRKFEKDGPRSLLIEDQIETSESTETITWQLLTQADVEVIEGGLILTQHGKQLEVSNLTHPDMEAVVVGLDPPPLELDRKIDNLKRIEYRYPAEIFENGKGTIKVRLSGN